MLGEPALVEPAQAFLAALVPGAVIEARTLERAVLVLSDQPGIRIAPILRPAQELGTGDVEVRLERAAGLSGEVGLDNHGNRFIGELGKDFANLGATGTAKVGSLGLSYPILRSQRSNLALAASWQHKRLNDRQRVLDTDNAKSSDSLPLAVSFDRRDGFLGGGITYGALAYSAGRLRLDSALEAADRASGQNTRGCFDKWNLDLARVQATAVKDLALFARLSAQWAGKNLDSSEGFLLGGASGVRAYPQGEGVGDAGWLVQLEARYTSGALTPYLFYDRGRVSINADNNLVAPANPNHRAIAGAGVGLRYASANWNLEASLAWRSRGGAPQSDPLERKPRLWATAGYRF